MPFVNMISFFEEKSTFQKIFSVNCINVLMLKLENFFERDQFYERNYLTRFIYILWFQSLCWKSNFWKLLFFQFWSQ